MPERLALSRTLWLIVAPPAAACAWQLAGGLARRRRPASSRATRSEGTGGLDRSARRARRLGVGSAVLASGATLGHALRLARDPTGSAALVQGASLGALAAPMDARIGLRFDPLSGTACGVACAVAVGAAVLLASRPASERSGRAWAWLELATAGGLLAFLADGFAAMVLGWTLAAAAAAWLAGWTDPRAGAVRATRSALAIVALLVGAVLRADPGGFDAPTGTLALVAFLVAAAAMSASTPPAGAPQALAAASCGGTIGLLGPFLLLRLESLTPLAPGAPVSPGMGPVVAAAGIAMLAGVAGRASLAPDGASRWLALAGGAPAGLTCVALAADGASGGRLVLVAAGLIAALLLLTAAARGIPGTSPRARDRTAGVEGAAPVPTDLEAALLGSAPERLGTLLLSFERWVVDAMGGAVVVIAHASAWALSRIDARRS
jgi:hypothetical protein